MNAATSKMNMAMPRVSVVVPIYNTERYLRQCLDSIVGQTLRDLEIILVDDGSTDGSAAIVDEYAKKDRRIVAIHQRNGGLGKAYNAGIARAGGEYIGLVESDDWIEPDMYELLYAEAKKYDVDLVKAPFYLYIIEDENAEPRDILAKLWNGEKILLDLTQDAPEGVFTIENCPLLIAYHTSIWSCLYHSDFLRQIPFVESPGASYQDAPFFTEVFCRAASIVVVPRPLMHWRFDTVRRQSSSTNRGRGALALIDRIREQWAILKKMGKYAALREEFWFGVFGAYCHFYECIGVEHRQTFFCKMRRLLQKLEKEGGFQYKYFSEESKRRVAQLLQRRHFASILTTKKKIRSFLFSIHIGRRDFIIQLLGLQISRGRYTKRPAFLAWRMG